MTQKHRSLSNPKGVHPPVGRYHHLARAKASELLFLAGQVAVDEDGSMIGEGDAGAQTRKAFENVGVVLEGAGASFDDIVQITTYLVGRESLPSYFDSRAQVFDEIFPNGDYPPNTLLIIGGLVDEKMLVEIEVVAAV